MDPTARQATPSTTPHSTNISPRSDSDTPSLQFSTPKLTEYATKTLQILNATLWESFEEANSEKPTSSSTDSTKESQTRDNDTPTSEKDLICYVWKTNNQEVPLYFDTAVLESPLEDYQNEDQTLKKTINAVVDLVLSKIQEDQAKAMQGKVKSKAVIQDGANYLQISKENMAHLFLIESANNKKRGKDQDEDELEYSDVILRSFANKIISESMQEDKK